MLIPKLVLGLIALTAGSAGATLAWQWRTHSRLREDSDRESSTAKREIHFVQPEHLRGVNQPEISRRARRANRVRRSGDAQVE